MRLNKGRQENWWRWLNEFELGEDRLGLEEVGVWMMKDLLEVGNWYHDLLVEI